MFIIESNQSIVSIASKNIYKYFDFSFFVCIFAFAFADMAQLVEQRIRNA